jgi:acetyltransferase-like isoleucine patch superfamily enzyme
MLARKQELARAIRAGMRVGENTRFVGTQRFGSEPYLVSIGRDCLITDGVTFLTHDGSIQVPYIRAGASPAEIYSRKSIFRPVVIGDNCFVGVGAVLLPGAEIGANSIIGAGSIVGGRFDDGMVIAGNPARAVSTVERYFDKRQPHVIDFTGDETAAERADIILQRLK